MVSSARLCRMVVLGFTVVAVPQVFHAGHKRTSGVSPESMFMATAGTDHGIGLTQAEYGLGDLDGGVEGIVRQGRVQGPVADDARIVLAELHRLDVLGTRAFLSPAFRVGHPLAFTQILEIDTFEAR